MSKIIYARAYTYEHQYNLLLGLAAKMSEEPFRLLVSLGDRIILNCLISWSLLDDVCLRSYLQIVDSVIALFRVDFTGRGELAERQVYLEKAYYN